MDRREFFQVSGGLTFAFAFPAFSQASEKQLNAWVRIAPDGTVTIFSAGAEMGQGTMTSLALIVADEMDADWSKVNIEFAPAEPEIYGSGGRATRSMANTGSRAVQSYYTDLRTAGAQVRKVLLLNASQHWNTDPETLKTEPGFVVDGSGRKLGYGEIASFAKVPSPLPAGELKNSSEFRYIGKPVPRRDTPLKANGTARYALDVQLPGMVYASVRHSPVHGGAPEGWNEAKVKSMRGVIGTVRLPEGVAVLADTLPHALAARQALEVKWSKSAATGFDSEAELNSSYLKVHSDPQAKTQTLDSKGDAKAAFAGAAKTYKAEYFSDYGYHAQMEPLNAVARFTSDSQVEIWEGTQDPGSSRMAVAKALGFKPEQVTFHQCYMGGGFGRRTLGDYASEAALTAKAIGKPVKLVWTREEDLQHGMFRPQSFQCLQAALDKDGKVAGWTHCVVGDGGGLLQSGVRISSYYQVPNQHQELRGVSHGVRLKHWRAVGHVFNVYAIESFVDQMAAAEGMDPIEFRKTRMHLTPKARAVFEKVEQMSDWKAPRPAGRALGVSISERSGSLGAGVAEISLDRASGKIHVHKAWLAVDGGLVVQPEMARANIESGIIWGLSGVLHERVTVKDGVVQQSNFHDYRVLRMADLPEVMEVAFLDRADQRPTGLGEIGNPWVAAAVANAFYKLTGKRLYHMPFTPERVRETVKT